MEFDEFEFPDHCVGAAVKGPATVCANAEGLMRLDLRAVFGISLAFILRDGVLVEINQDTIVHKGDRGLVVCVPDRQTGRSWSTLTDKILRPLFDYDEFWQRLFWQSRMTPNGANGKDA